MWSFDRMSILVIVTRALLVLSGAVPATSTCPDIIWVTEYQSKMTITVTQVSLYTPSIPLADEKTTAPVKHIVLSSAVTIDPAACPDATISTTTVFQTASAATSAPPFLNTNADTTQSLSAITTSSASYLNTTTLVSSEALNGTAPNILSSSLSTPMSTPPWTNGSITSIPALSMTTEPLSAAPSAANATSLDSSSFHAPFSSTQWTNESSTSLPALLSTSNGSMSSQATTASDAADSSLAQSGTSTSGPPNISSSGVQFGTTSSDDGLTYTGILTSATLSPSFWLQPTPTIQVVEGGSLDLPCVTLTKNATLSYPDYTTSLCQPHCGSVKFQSKTTIKIAPITTDTLCWMPITAESTGVITAAYQVPTTTSSVAAPSGMSACPAVHRDTDKDKKCGPDSHYTCAKKECCSKSGKCGKGQDFCDDGCQPDYGYCWSNSTSCTMPEFGKDDDDNNMVPIYPVLYSDFPRPKEYILGPWPPVFRVEFGNFKYDCLLCDRINELTKMIWGIKEIECGLLGCDGLDMGWFIRRLPKIGCPSLLSWVCHHILHCCCCGAGGSSSSQVPDCNSLICDDTPETGLNNNGKLCDESLETCDEPKQESSVSSSSLSSSTSSSSDCGTASRTTVTDQTILCGLVTGLDGFSSQSCTSTKTNVRGGCSLTPTTTSVTTTACHTRTATLATAECDVHTAVNETASTDCTKTRSTVISGCTVTDHTTSQFTISCPTTTATHLSVSCGVITGANSTMTSCSQTRQDFETGCDVTGTTTSLYNTQCSTTATVTNQDVNCFAFNGTLSGTVTPGSTTCTATSMSVVSGCDVSATTTTSVSISELNVCLVGATGDITIEPYTESSTSYASNTTTAS